MQSGCCRPDISVREQRDLAARPPSRMCRAMRERHRETKELAGVAQLAEQRSCKAKVVGSMPTAGTRTMNLNLMERDGDEQGEH